jgi:hypothetical protein
MSAPPARSVEFIKQRGASLVLTIDGVDVPLPVEAQHIRLQLNECSRPLDVHVTSNHPIENFQVTHGNVHKHGSGNIIGKVKIGGSLRF